MNSRSIKYSKLRIIGGKFRGRKISFSTEQNTELRPTLDQVRETIFNWLAPYIVGANCLDLFAGSGAFGLEALSRGAKFVVSVESNNNTYKDLIQNKMALRLSDQELNIIHNNALSYLGEQHLSTSSLLKMFNVVFLDPPYSADPHLLLTSLNLLIKNNFLHVESKICFECAQGEQIFKEKNFPAALELSKASQAGKVHFYLVEYNGRSHF